MLLERGKENKLAYYEKEAYQLTARYADQVELKSLQGSGYIHTVPDEFSTG